MNKLMRSFLILPLLAGSYLAARLPGSAQG